MTTKIKIIVLLFLLVVSTIVAALPAITLFRSDVQEYVLVGGLGLVGLGLMWLFYIFLNNIFQKDYESIANQASLNNNSLIQHRHLNNLLIEARKIKSDTITKLYEASKIDDASERSARVNEVINDDNTSSVKVLDEMRDILIKATGE